MRVSVCLGAILNPEYLDFHFSYSAPRSRIAGIYSGIYSRIYSYSGISQTNAPLLSCFLFAPRHHSLSTQTCEAFHFAGKVLIKQAYFKYYN